MQISKMAFRILGWWEIVLMLMLMYGGGMGEEREEGRPRENL